MGSTYSTSESGRLKATPFISSMPPESLILQAKSQGLVNPAPGVPFFVEDFFGAYF
jgi:hypothetical protein